MALKPDFAMPANLRMTWLGLLGSFLGLLLYFALNSWLALGGPSLALPVVWLLQTLPLLIFLPGLLRARPRTCAWLSFVVLLYFIHAVLVAFDPARRLLGLIEVLLCVVMFVLLIIYIRQYRAAFGRAI